MTRIFTGCLLSLLMVVSLSGATVPLSVEQEITFPPYTNGDIQYVANDSTLSWVWVLNETITWKANPVAPEQTFTVPASVVAPYGERFGASTVACVKWPTAPDDFCVLWQRPGIHYYDPGSMDYQGAILLAVFNLNTGQILDSISIIGSSFTDFGVAQNWNNMSVTGVQAWPPLPSVTHYLLLSYHHSFIGYREEGYNLGHEWGYGLVAPVSSGLFPNPLLWQVNRERIQPFGDPTSSRVAFVGTHTEWVEYPDETISQSWHWIGTLPVGNGAASRDSLHGGIAVPQQDADGTQRLIIGDGRALDPVTFQELWYNPYITGEGRVFTARLAPGADESILVYRTIGDPSNQFGYFRVFEPQAGARLDSTVSFVGRVVRVLKNHNGGHRLITRWSYAAEEPSIVRVYRFEAEPPRTLTIRYQPDSGDLRLDWTPDPAAQTYRIWAGSAYGACDELIATLPASATTCTVPLAGITRFFTVTAEYPD